MIKRKSVKKKVIRVSPMTYLNRASKVTFRVPYSKLTTSEKHYIRVGVARLFVGDRTRGGYGGKYKRYVLKGGRLPKPIK